MATEHTPGPWLVNPSSITSFVSTTAVNAHGSHRPICEVFGSDSECNANARLIAAAPTLLAAAEAALSLSAAYNSKTQKLELLSIDHWDEVRAQLRAAIQQARGGTASS